MAMLKGFKNFLMRGDVIAVAVGLSVALAFSNLVKAFTDAIVNPLIAAAQGNVEGPGLGWQLVNGGGDGTYLNLGAFISAIIYFIIFIPPYSHSAASMPRRCRVVLRQAANGHSVAVRSAVLKGTASVERV
jgi:hypothetical protein